MNTMDDRKQKELVRERFTNTAEVFGNYAVGRRAHLAEALAQAVNCEKNDRAADLACGPVPWHCDSHGTFDGSAVWI